MLKFMNASLHRWLPATLVVLLAVPVGGPAAAQDAEPEAAEVTIAGFAYQPFDTVIEAGSTVRWVNADPYAHTVTFDDGSFSATVQPGGTIEHTFDEPGTVGYYCLFHGTPGRDQYGLVTVVAPGEPLPEPVPPPGGGGLGAVVALQGDDAVTTAIAWSRQRFPVSGASGEALIGRDDDFADLLASGGAQGALDAPLLLTPTGALDPRTLAELRRLGTDTVSVLGGEGAVGPAVTDALTGEGFQVRRLAGETRTGTAIEIARTVLPAADAAVVARAFGDAEDPTRGPADSFAAGLFAARLEVPLLLTETATLSPDTGAYLAESAIERVVVAGGPAAVSEQVVADLEAQGLEVARVGGRSRAETAVAFLEALHPPGAPGPQAIALVDGYKPDAFANFAASGAGAPILLTNFDVPATETTAVLGDPLGGVLLDGTDLLCGPNVSPAACIRAGDVSGTATLGPGSVLAFLEARHVAGGGGMPAASSRVVLGRTPAPDALCYQYNVYGLDEPLLQAHLHGAAEDGQALTVGLTTYARQPGQVFGCAFGLDPALVSRAFRAPGSFTVDLHTAAAPGGAVAGPVFAPTDLLVADLSGDQEAPDPGAPPPAAGRGLLALPGTPDELCVEYATRATDPIGVAHVHTGSAGAAGPELIPLPAPEPAGGGTGLARCLQGQNPDALGALRAAPSEHYLHLHNAPFPDGALRGQLLRPLGPPGA